MLRRAGVTVSGQSSGYLQELSTSLWSDRSPITPKTGNAQCSLAKKKDFKDLAGPFPYIRLTPTGGVTIDNVGEWVAAGAVAVGIGSDLLDKEAIDEEKYSVLTERAKRLTDNFQGAKRKLKK